MVHEEFSRARIDKDRNYDGKFLFGVQTTGIFCRPSCPSPTAKEENVLYFSNIYEALERGMRPCLRCRPDVNLEHYHGNISGQSTVDAALAEIEKGYLSYHSIADLADKLMVSERHMRKLFVETIGVPPIKIAKYHKALFAKRLLAQSTEAITDVAFAAGFKSIRQFNDVIREMFGKSPSEIRKQSRSKSGDTGNATLLLRYRAPFNFTQMLDFIRPRTINKVEVVTDSVYSRTFRTGRTSGFFTVEDKPDQSALELRIKCEDVRCYMEIYNRVRRMFDLDRDFGPINEMFAADEILIRGMEQGHVPRLPVAFDPFEATVRAILGQQITVKAATTLAGRVAERAGLSCGEGFPEGLEYFFPDAIEMNEMDLDGLGMTRIRQETIYTVAQAVIDGKFKLTANQTFEKFSKEFSVLKGIGDWTVNYVGMRGLGMIDSFPASDLGVLKALAVDGEYPKPKQVREMTEKWKPYRAYATLCLWNGGTEK